MNGLNIYTASYSSGCSLSLPTTIDRSASAAANMNQSKKVVRNEPLIPSVTEGRVTFAVWNDKNVFVAGKLCKQPGASGDGVGGGGGD